MNGNSNVSVGIVDIVLAVAVAAGVCVVFDVAVVV